MRCKEPCTDIESHQPECDFVGESVSVVVVVCAYACARVRLCACVRVDCLYNSDYVPFQ